MKVYEIHEAVRRSVRADFPEVIRITAVGPGYYFPYRRFLLGKAMRIVKRCPDGIWCEFVHASDGEALNAVAGWSAAKTKYLLQSIKFKTL